MKQGIISAQDAEKDLRGEKRWMVNLDYCSSKSLFTILVNVNNSLLRLGVPAHFLNAAGRINYS